MDVAGDVAIGKSGNGIGFHHDQRRPAQNGGDHDGSRYKSAHTEDGGGLELLENLSCGRDARRQLQRRSKFRAEAHAVQLADADMRHIETGPRDDARFDAGFGSDKKQLMTAAKQYSRDRNSGEYVPARSPTG